MWFEDHENVISVIRWAYRHEEAKTAGDVLYMLEKPWKFGWIWERLTTQDTDPTCQKCAGKGTVDTDDNVQNAHLYTIKCPDCGGSGMDAPWVTP